MLPAASGFQALYANESKCFWTVQTHTPEPIYHPFEPEHLLYAPVEVVPVALVGVGGWVVDASDPYVPKVKKPGAGRWQTLNRAIQEGKVLVRARRLALTH